MRVLHLSRDDMILLAEAASRGDATNGSLRVAIDSSGFKFSLNQGVWTHGMGIVDPTMTLEVSCGECGQRQQIQHGQWHQLNLSPCRYCPGAIDLVHARRHADDPCRAEV